MPRGRSAIGLFSLSASGNVGARISPFGIGGVLGRRLSQFGAFRKGQRFVRRSTIPAICFLSLGLASFAAAARADVVDDRVTAMKHIRNSYRVLVDMAKAGTFDAATAQNSAFEIVTEMMIFKELFPAGSQQGDKLSRPEIWTDRAGFDAAWEAGDSAASKLGTVNEADAYVPTLQTLAAACRGCHKKYVVAQ
jgi:cytochrome c556